MPEMKPMDFANREGDRNTSFGEAHRQTPVDRFGVWLSSVRIRRAVRSFAGKDVGDFGCGFQADFMRTVLPEVASATLVDLSLAEDLKTHPKVTALQGVLPEILEKVPDASLDVVLCNSVLEHLWSPAVAVRHMRRVLRPGGVAFVNVPSWRGKFFLETAAFRLHVSPAQEMDDHKRYYSPRELWTLLVEGGFRPSEIKACHTHKFGLNTFAWCRLS